MNKQFLNLAYLLVLFIVLITIPFSVEAKKKKKNNHKIKVLLIDGQSKYHNQWKEWTPVLLKQLDDAELFRIDVATSPMKGESLDKFNPKFKNYDVVVTLYDGDIWSMRTQRNLEKYMTGGGGLVVIHAANNAFPRWEAYNQMIGLGGWGDRNESAGPYVYFDEKGEIVHDNSPGQGGHHGLSHEYVVEIRIPDHPIMEGIPTKWLHAEDELYDMLRGPAKNMKILASTYSAEEFEGTQRHEPVIMAIEYGDGRIFHTIMGHDKQSLSCVGFMTTFIRGCQWASKNKVTFEVPDDFPDEKVSSMRTY